MAGGVGKVARTARGLEALDGMGAVAVGVQGVGNALGAGNVNLQNGLAIVGGALGVGQLNAARNAGWGRKRIDLVIATLSWNELTKFATGEELNPKAFAKDFQTK